MKRIDARGENSWATVGMRRIMMPLGAGLCAFALTGCLLPCGIFRHILIIKARVVSGATAEGVSDAAIGGFLYTNGEKTSYRDPLGPTVELDSLPPDSEGRFQIRFRAPEFGEACGAPPFERVVRDPPFPTPDQLELIVVIDGCEQRITIEINEDTVVDMSFPADILELREPILVPPCE